MLVNPNPSKDFYISIFSIKTNPQKPQTKVKRTREEMQVTLENKRKVIAKSLRSVLKRNNRVEEGGTS